jgi:hypothetical protein
MNKFGVCGYRLTSRGSISVGECRSGLHNSAPKCNHLSNQWMCVGEEDEQRSPVGHQQHQAQPSGAMLAETIWIERNVPSTWSQSPVRIDGCLGQTLPLAHLEVGLGLDSLLVGVALWAAITTPIQFQSNQQCSSIPLFFSPLCSHEHVVLLCLDEIEPSTSCRAMLQGRRSLDSSILCCQPETPGGDPVSCCPF